MVTGAFTMRSLLRPVLEVADQPQVPLFDRQRRRRDRTQRRASAAGGIGRVDRNRRWCTSRWSRTYSASNRLLAWRASSIACSLGRRSPTAAGSASSVERQLPAGPLVLGDHRARELADPRRRGALHRKLRRADHEQVDRGVLGDEVRVGRRRRPRRRRGRAAPEWPLARGRSRRRTRQGSRATPSARTSAKAQAGLPRGALVIAQARRRGSRGRAAYLRAALEVVGANGGDGRGCRAPTVGVHPRAVHAEAHERLELQAALLDRERPSAGVVHDVDSVRRCAPSAPSCGPPTRSRASVRNRSEFLNPSARSACSLTIARFLASPAPWASVCARSPNNRAGPTRSRPKPSGCSWSPRTG